MTGTTSIPSYVHTGPSDGWHGVISTDPSNPFQPEAHRYHLYIGLFCPFAHRANLVRHIKGLSNAIDISVVMPYPKGDDKGWPGWKFPDPEGQDYPNATADKLFGSKYLHEIYFKADKDYQGRYSVPVLWDTKLQTIVNNESAELLRWMQTGFDEILPLEKREITLYPEELRSEIDEMTTWVQRDLNSGVYKAGFAPDQAAYDAALPPVFAAMNKLEKIASQNGGPYILGKKMTEIDVRVFATLIRFDVVYVQHFKCNLGMVRREYPVLYNWLKRMYWKEKGFRESTDFKHIKENYTKSHADINPKAITPMGPWPDIEDGYEEVWSRIKPGGIDMSQVVEYEKTLS